MGAYRNFWTPTAQIMRIYSVSVFFLGPILMVPFGLLFFALPYGFSFRDIRPTTLALLSVVFVFTAGTEMAYYYNVHYSAPVTCVVIALLLIALQCLRAWNKSGLFITRAIPLACVIALATARVPLRCMFERLNSTLTTGMNFLNYIQRDGFRAQQSNRILKTSLEIISSSSAITLRTTRSPIGCLTKQILNTRESSGRVTWARRRTRNCSTL